MVETNEAARFWPQFAAPLRGLGARVAHWLAPASDASSDDAAYRISVELPGVSESDVTLSVTAGLLSVQGEKTSTREDKGETWFFTEREYGSFRRSFRLPPDADEAKIEAHMKDGVLEITVPRKSEEETAEGRRIPVRKG